MTGATIRILLAEDEHLVRGALAALLSLEDDLSVVAQAAFSSVRREINSPIVAGHSWDGDCLYTSDPSRFVKWGGATYGSLAAFRSATAGKWRAAFAKAQAGRPLPY